MLLGTKAKAGNLIIHDPPEVHEVARVVGLPVDGAVLHHVVHVQVEDDILNQLQQKLPLVSGRLGG